jgi:hypothetical protein
MTTTRRSFLKSLGAVAVGFMADPVIELLVPEPNKIWVVGAQLTNARDLAKPANFGLPFADQLIGEYLKSTAGRAQLAASMVQPLRRRRPNYSTIARQMFPIQQLPLYLERQWPSLS